MAGRIREVSLAAILFVLVFALSFRINSSFQFPFPPFDQLIYDLSDDFSGMTSYEKPLGSDAGFRDFGGLLFGMRRLTADVAWVSVLQYYGSHESHGGGEHHHDFAGGDYPAFKKMILRVVRLDPSFYYVWLVGAGALAFNLNQPEEGLKILEEGIRYNPTYWKFRLYVGAIVYKQKGQFDQMISLLEDAIRYPDCPTMVKSILANIYKERGNNARALQIWLDVLESPTADAWYRYQAGKQIEELRAKLKI